MTAPINPSTISGIQPDDLPLPTSWWAIDPAILPTTNQRTHVIGEKTNAKKLPIAFTDSPSGPSFKNHYARVL
jgi:hypothetical protein